MVVLAVGGLETLETRRQSINEAGEKHGLQRAPILAFCGRHSLAGITALATALRLGGRRCATARSAHRRPLAGARKRSRRRNKVPKIGRFAPHQDPVDLTKEDHPNLASDASKTPTENALQLLRAREQGVILNPVDVALAGGVIAESQTAVSDGLLAFDAALHELTLKKCLQDVHIWHSCSQNPLLRLVLLHQLGLKGGLKAWSALGISNARVMDTVGQVAVFLNGQQHAHSKQKLEYDLKAAASSVLGVLGEELVAASAPALTASVALALHQHFAEALWSSSLLPLLDAAFEDPTAGPLLEEDLLSLALALEAQGLADSSCWEKFASLMTRHWSTLNSRSLLEAMLVLPELLRAAPGGLEAALTPHCHVKTLSSLPYSCVVWLLDSWAVWACGKRLPPLLAQLLRPAVERHLKDFDVRRLITASQILDACDGSEAVVDILLFWQSWCEHLVSECKVKTWRWSSFQETLREVAGSKHLHRMTEQSPTLGDMIMEGILLTELVGAKNALPLELLLDVCRRLPEERRGELRGALQDLLWHCLAGRGGGLSLLNAVSVAQGETSLPCEPGSQLFDALADHIVKELSGPAAASAVSFFCHCRPSPELQEAVLKKVKGWQALELNVMLR